MGREGREGKVGVVRLVVGGCLAAAGGGVGVLAGALGDVEPGELLGDSWVDAHRVH